MEKQKDTDRSAVTSHKATLSHGIAGPGARRPRLWRFGLGSNPPFGTNHASAV